MKLVYAARSAASRASSDTRTTSGKRTAVAPGGRQASGFFDSDLMKGLYRMGRGVIDSFGGALGIPMPIVRQNLRNQGVDPDVFEDTLSRSFDQDIADGSFMGMSDEDMNNDIYQAQLLAKRSPALTMLVGAVAAIFLLGMIRK